MGAAAQFGPLWHLGVKNLNLKPRCQWEHHFAQRIRYQVLSSTVSTCMITWWKKSRLGSRIGSLKGVTTLGLAPCAWKLELLSSNHMQSLLFMYEYLVKKDSSQSFPHHTPESVSSSSHKPPSHVYPPSPVCHSHPPFIA